MKIVCTGYGTLAPGTNDSQEFLSHIQEGECVLTYQENAGPKGESNIVGLINEEIESYTSDKAYKRFPKAAILGIAAAKEAIQQAELDTEKPKIGLFVGTSLGGLGEGDLQNGVSYGQAGEHRRVPIMAAHYANYHSIAASINHELGLKGLTRTISTGCTAGLEAIEEAMLYLHSGKIDTAIVCGTDIAITQATTYAFSKLRNLPFDQSLDEGAVPFSDKSKGFAMADGAGVVIMEREQTALDRGATIRGEIQQVVSNNDGTGLFSTDTEGKQLKKALHEVVQNQHVDFVNSQALGVQVNDRMEEACSFELFGHKVPFTSIKSTFGNPFAAGGVFQVISSLLSIEHGFIPGTTRTDQSGFESMNIVTKSVKQAINGVAITNHGLGGNNACAYIKKYS